MSEPVNAGILREILNPQLIMVNQMRTLITPAMLDYMDVIDADREDTPFCLMTDEQLSSIILGL